MALANLNTADFIQGSGVSQTGNVIDVTGGGGGDLEAVLTTGNDGGALQIKNIADGSDLQDAITLKQLQDAILLDEFAYVIGSFNYTQRI